MGSGDERVWWRDGVLYQIYPRSFADANGDGVGDINGIRAHLDHVASLGVDGIWLSPWFASPNADHGYDVADYKAIHPELGTSAEADSLIAEAHDRGLRVILDIVPNHTSDQHAWFVNARSSRDSSHRDWYVWADGRDGGPPNNWVSSFGTGRSAWEWDEATGQWYLCHFTPEQPDLNWWNPAVHDAFDAILRAWFDRGVDGFRIDVCHMIVKDAALRDNPAATDDDPIGARLLGQVQRYNSCRPELHDVLRRWRTIADSYDPPRILLGETVVNEPEHFASFFGTGDELNTAYSFQMLYSRFTAEKLRNVVETTEAALPAAGWPAWPLGNHDNTRYPTRWCDGDEARMRAAVLLVMSLRGTPLLYYGDEIGMAEVDVPRDRMQDPVAEAFDGVFGRDGCRTPMQWSDTADVGFGSHAEPWLPYGDATTANVADQEADPDSLLHFVRAAIALRRGLPDLSRGDYETLPSDVGVWVFRRGSTTVVAANLTDTAQRVELPVTTVIRLTSAPGGRMVITGSPLDLAPWEAVAVTIGHS